MRHIILTDCSLKTLLNGRFEVSCDKSVKIWSFFEKLYIYSERWSFVTYFYDKNSTSIFFEKLGFLGDLNNGKENKYIIDAVLVHPRLIFEKKDLFNVRKIPMKRFETFDRRSWSIVEIVSNATVQRKESNVAWSSSIITLLSVPGDN